MNNYITNKIMGKMTFFLSLCILICLPLITSCTDEDEVTMPSASFNVSSTDVSINETVTFTFTGTDAKQIVIFPGDEGHDYDYVNNGSTGLVMSKGIGTYAYKKAGIYKAVIVATNYDKEAKSDKVSTSEVTITVSDEDNTIESVILQKDLYNKELAAQINEDNVLIAFPYKVSISNKDIAVKMNAQRLSITPSSSGASILVNGVAYSDKTKYDLTKATTFSVTAASGDIKEYKVNTLYYPVFETFSINGVSGTVTYSPYYYDKTYISVVLPAGTDLTDLVPTFTSADAKSIKIDDESQTSGTSHVNFTNSTTYTLTNNIEGDTSLSCDSKVIVTVTVK